MKSISLALLIVSVGSGCTTQYIYSGSVTSCAGEPIPGADVEAWGNQWMPFYPPLWLGETRTDSAGRFILRTEKEADFFLYSGEKLKLSNPRDEITTNCDSENEW